MPDKATWPIKIQIRIDGSLLEERFHVESFSSREELGRPFEHVLVLSWPGYRDINSSGLPMSMQSLGAEISVAVTGETKLPQDQAALTNGYHGTVTERTFEPESGLITFVMTPKLWDDGMGRISKIVARDMKVSDVLKQTMGEIKESCEVEATKILKPWVIRYQETITDFTHRLMEEEGLTYNYDQDSDGGGYKLKFFTPQLAGPAIDYDSREDLSAQITYRKVPKQLEVKDFSPEKNDVLLKRHRAKKSYLSLVSDFIDELHESGNLEGKLEQSTRNQGGANALDIRAQALLASATVDAITFHGQTPGMSKIRPGQLVNLAGIEAVPGGITKLLCTASHLTVTKDGARVSFTAMSAQDGYAPVKRTEKPLITGVQTAIVTQTGEADGPGASADAQVDVGIKFHWDPENEIFARVAQGLASKSRGTFISPQVGDEVVVSFVDGDPDRPIVVGSVSNTQTNIAAAGMDVEKAHKEMIGLVVDDSSYVTWDSKNKLIDFYGTQKLYGRVDDDVVIVHGATGGKPAERKRGDSPWGSKTKWMHAYQVSKKDKKVSDNYEVELDQTFVKNVERNYGANLTEEIKGKTSVTGDQDITIESKKKITLKVGGNTVTIDQSGIKVNGTQVDVKGKTAAKMSAPQAEVSGSAMTTIKGGIVKIN